MEMGSWLPAALIVSLIAALSVGGTSGPAPTSAVLPRVVRAGEVYPRPRGWFSPRADVFRASRV